MITIHPKSGLYLLTVLAACSLNSCVDDGGDTNRDGGFGDDDFADDDFADDDLADDDLADDDLADDDLGDDDLGDDDDAGPDAGDDDIDAGMLADGGIDTDGGIDAGDGGLGFPESARIETARVPDGFVAWQWAEGLAEPRGMMVDEQGNVLVVEQDANRVMALWDDDGNGVSGPTERQVIAEAPGLNHGVALAGGYLYASSDTTIYRWEYAAPRVALGAFDAVVTGIPGGGNHTTRTLLVDDRFLYVSVGSAANVDPDSSRARVVRFELVDLASPVAFATGELFADGLRNEVGLGLDEQGRVWGVENGMDNLFDSDLGGDIHNENPAEELNLFEQAGSFYGYPYCWTEYELGDAGMGPGTQWAFEGTAMDAGAPFEAVSDAWCRDEDNVVPPVMVLPGHSAPLDLLFYAGGSFPDDYNGDALVTLHGSWNAEPPVGYKVVRIPFDDDGMPLGTWEPLYEYEGAGDTGTDWNERPVDMAVLPLGPLLVTSDDDADRIIAIDYRP